MNYPFKTYMCDEEEKRLRPLPHSILGVKYIPIDDKGNFKVVK